MKRRVIAYCVVFFILQLLKALLLNDYGKDYGKSRIEISLGESSALSYNEVDLREEYIAYCPTLISRIQNAGSVGGKAISIIGTNDAYRQLENMQMVDGAFFGSEAVNEKRNVAVISDELSYALFRSNKAACNRYSRFSIAYFYSKDSAFYCYTKRELSIFILVIHQKIVFQT